MPVIIGGVIVFVISVVVIVMCGVALLLGPTDEAVSLAIVPGEPEEQSEVTDDSR